MAVGDAARFSAGSGGYRTAPHSAERTVADIMRDAARDAARDSRRRE
jgi:hypothetical protein